MEDKALLNGADAPNKENGDGVGAGGVEMIQMNMR
jgi:hypothetical protein